MNPRSLDWRAPSPALAPLYGVRTVHRLSNDYLFQTMTVTQLGEVYE